MRYSQDGTTVRADDDSILMMSREFSVNFECKARIEYFYNRSMEGKSRLRLPVPGIATQVAWEESTSTLRAGKSKSERPTVVIVSGSRLSKMNWIAFIDQIDGWDFVNWSRADNHIHIKQSLISVRLSVLYSRSFRWVCWLTIYLDLAHHFSHLLFPRIVTPSIFHWHSWADLPKTDFAHHLNFSCCWSISIPRRSQFDDIGWWSTALSLCSCA
jgi:hypothetical protein